MVALAPLAPFAPVWVTVAARAGEAVMAHTAQVAQAAWWSNFNTRANLRASRPFVDCVTRFLQKPMDRSFEA